MQKLQISYVTWTRSDANGLFDYEDLKDKKPDNTLIIEKSGLICRNKQDYKLQFSSSNVDEEGFEKILKVSKQENHFLLKSLDIANEPLFKIIEQEFPKTHQIKPKDNLRLGKVVVEVLELDFKQKKSISSYTLIRQQMSGMQGTHLNSVRQITPDFYGRDEMKMSKLEFKQTSPMSCYEQNPACRYCYSRTVTLDNPFHVSCACKGSARYIHEKCLLEWFLRRGGLQQRVKSGIVWTEEKLFKCEVCHEFFYLPEIWKKCFSYQKLNQKNLEGDPFEEVLILHVKYQTNWLYFIDLGQQREILIGRSLQNDIVLNELSVSRLHAKLQVDSIRKLITLSNNNAKFGTLVHIEDVEVQNQQTYQVGRTKMSFKKHEKKSFFDRIGIFCFVQQKLAKEIPKNKRLSKMQMQEREQAKIEPEE